MKLNIFTLFKSSCSFDLPRKKSLGKNEQKITEIFLKYALSYPLAPSGVLLFIQLHKLFGKISN